MVKSESTPAALDMFVSAGLSEQKAKETLKNAALSEFFVAVLNEASRGSEELQARDGKGEGLSKAQGSLLYQVASRLKAQCRARMPLLVRAVCADEISSERQLSAALDFLLAHAGAELDERAFRAAAGIGVRVSPEQIEQAVAQVVAAFRDDLCRDRYSFNTSRLLSGVMQQLAWANGADVKREVDLQVLSLLGPKTLEEMQQGGGKKKAAKDPANKAPKAKDTAALASDAASDGADTIEDLMRRRTNFHKVGENYKTEGYVVTPNTKRLLAEHVKRVGGKVVTRFPPEPNGILHIGHAKAINIDFAYAKVNDGICYLRFDDTNPEKEEQRFVDGIRENIEWLGYKPYKITYSSDYFDQLHEWAVELIRRGHAYVCHQPADEMKGFEPPPSAWRDRPVAESLQLFDDMKNGKLEEGSATLRLKTTLEEGKQDPVAYRIKYIAHHRTGDKWCIYPTYDYTHCLCDSIENITHSLCTKEFQSRRSSYYWLCNALDLYCPVQWEFGRLSVTGTVVSKRKIQKLITTDIVSDWDDPRLFTLTSLRRRGFPAEAVNNFVAKMGVTMALAAVDPHMLDACVRDVLNRTARRAMGVLEPISVRIDNWSAALPTSVDVADFPAEPARGTHAVPFAEHFFIERDDFRNSCIHGFKRFAMDQPVGLKHAGLVLTAVDVTQDDDGAVTALRVNCQPLTDENKPKGFIHWVAKPLHCQVRLYDRLFKHKHPEDANEVPGGFLTDCNKDSLRVLPRALVDRSVAGAAAFEQFQFERLGYFSVDPDSTADQLVFNRTVLLKEDAGKKH